MTCLAREREGGGVDVFVGEGGRTVWVDALSGNVGRGGERGEAAIISFSAVLLLLQKVGGGVGDG